MNSRSLRNTPKSVLAVISTTLMAFAAISLVTACSPKPTAEESAAQTKLVVDQAVAEAKKEMTAEKDQKDAASAVRAEAKSSQDAAVAHAVANERKKNAAEQRAANAKNERRAEQRASAASAARSDNYSSNAINANTCNSCGVVQSVNEIDTEGNGSGLGVVAGGVLGGVLGHQVGGGSGRDLATVAGALGGAYAGNTIEKNTKKTRSYRIEVKMNSGEVRIFNQSGAPDLASGDRVRIENNVVVRR